MDIQIHLLDNVSIEENSCVCYSDNPGYIAKVLQRHSRGYSGVVIIDGVSIVFTYSTLGNDGLISTNDQGLRMIVKSLIPMYFYNRILNGSL